MKLMLMFATVLPLSVCNPTGPAIDRATICAGWKPILISRTDVLTEQTAQDILAHNEFGLDQGCWRQ